MAEDQYTNQDGPEISLPASATLAAYQFHIMTINTDGRVVLADDADVTAEPMVGILQNKPTAIDQPAVLRISGICKVMGGASLDEGTWVTCDSDGHAVAAVTADQTIGFCIDTMTSTYISRIMIARVPYYTAPS